MSITTRRNPRRRVHDLLDTPLRRLKWIKKQWTVPSTVYMSPAHRKPGDNAVLRPREPHEYPENNAVQWTALINQVDAALLELSQLRDFAVEQTRQLS